MRVDISVTRHAMEKFRERTGRDLKESDIVTIFRREGYDVIEPAKKGRLIVNAGDFVWVIYRTNTRIVVCTSFGFADAYQRKRPHLRDVDGMIERIQWQRFLKKRHRG